jgi:hypothetical protein
MSLTVNAKGLAEACGFTKGRISQFKSKGIITPNQHGLYDLEEDSKRIGRPVDLGGLSMETPDDGDEVKVIDFGKWRAFKMREDALKAQRERQVYEQDLLPRAEVIMEVGQAIHIAKTKFLTVPTAISGIVAIEDDAAVCKEIIEGSIREILVELSSHAALYGAAGDMEATTKAIS